MNNNCKNTKLQHFNLCQYTNFPFIEETFDAMTYYQMLCKMSKLLNDVIDFVDIELSDKLKEYIDIRFNDIMMDSMYEPETETLVLYLDKGVEV